jgi:arginine utilization protein RocB
MAAQFGKVGALLCLRGFPAHLAQPCRGIHADFIGSQVTKMKSSQVLHFPTLAQLTQANAGNLCSFFPSRALFLGCAPL